ncbi:hypothetical protein PP175_14330 [Aneurinibacillus sp. Ricciae_BoGa-3]|uniref:hypothetical protein n=1 Tax=Aneurinibacillus sp. Ricciae_BoGa-3 TaxID=3022697 RepID=UPI0023413E10|nr:hypothetical protein [Aneurinibacillus sp. Ricciae_BoGa-3]WCK52610.1 hypothetical protein PP175_14330 [Aneurinibacillus sp. Ricciae_BoGa-3]
MNATKPSIITIDTTVLSEEVYKRLHSQSQDVNELSAYINRVVEYDLARERHQWQEQTLVTLMQELLGKFDMLQRNIMLPSAVSVTYRETMSQDDPANGGGNFTEGQLVWEEEVTGKIEEQIDLDF